jgi:hypothetical protein
MIVDRFDKTTIANLKEALERTTELFPERLSDHPSRGWLARSLLEIAKKGQTRIGPLTEAALCTAAARFTMPDVPINQQGPVPASPERTDRCSGLAAPGSHARAELTDYEKTPGCGMLATEDDTNPCPTG